MLLRFTAATLILCFTLMTAHGETTGILFETNIKPLLTAKCGKCHRENERKGGLDLSSMEAIHTGGETGDDLLTASLEDNALWHQIESGEMPPEGEPALSEQEQLLVQRWILAGTPSQTSIVKTRELNQHDVLPILLLQAPNINKQSKTISKSIRKPSWTISGRSFSPSRPRRTNRPHALRLHVAGLQRDKNNQHIKGRSPRISTMGSKPTAVGHCPS